MLVLALQFSRCDHCCGAGACGVRRETISTQRRSRDFDSLKTEEKTVVAGGVSRGRDEPYDHDIS
jgi:hypothetical protein